MPHYSRPIPELRHDLPVLIRLLPACCGMKAYPAFRNQSAASRA